MIERLHKTRAIALFISIVGGISFASPAIASEVRPENVETIIVTGSILKNRASLPGSSFEVSAEDITRLRPISVSDLFAQVPGIQVVSEDLFGLKVNISVRGLTPRRSARTLLLEDGMPIQPAPYSEPSAHYIPPFERIERIEVLKGSGEILYGPQSLGGMINFITKPVPDRFTSQLDLAMGTRNFASGHLMMGAGNETGGVRLDLLSKQSDGTRDGHSTTFTDFSLKASIRLSDTQAIAARFTQFNEDTALTEAGLDAARYAVNSFSNAFSNDHFDLQRTALHLVHDIEWTPHVAQRTQIYAADTFRASYRQTDTSTDAMTPNPATGCEGAARTDYERFAARCGNKMRPRQFYFAGIESTLTAATQIWGHKLTNVFGVRLHHEDADRRRYNGLTPDARETSIGSVLRDKNLIQTDALSAYVISTLEVGKIALSVGLRNEDIVTTNRSVVANFLQRDLMVSKTQNLTLPGFGITWTPTNVIEVFGGIHNGFAPPRPDRDVDPLAPANQVRPEESTNYELGLRATVASSTRLEATAFWQDFHELIVAGPLLGLASGTLVNAGKATHAGIELYLRHQWQAINTARIKPWLTVSLTNLAKAQFESNVGEGGANVRGNRIPYAPKWMGDVGLGFESDSGFGGSLNVHYVGEQFGDARNTVAQSDDGTKGLIPGYSLINLSMTYQPKARDWEIYLSVHNLLDHQYISTRTDGLFAGPPRQALIGLRKSF